MNELTKVKRVMQKSFLTLLDFISLDGSTGQNAFEQAKQFAATEVTSLAVTKLGKGKRLLVFQINLKFP
jgi:fused signal recognition particle receptor